MSYWKEIYSYEQLNSLIKDGVIRESLYVNSNNVNILKNVKKICIGPLGSVHFNNLVDLGELEDIDCEFSFFGNLKSLNNPKSSKTLNRLIWTFTRKYAVFLVFSVFLAKVSLNISSQEVYPIKSLFNGVNKNFLNPNFS